MEKSVSRENQRQTIKQLFQNQVDKVGSVYLLIPARWWREWKEYVNYDEKPDQPETGNPGPIDTRDLVLESNGGEVSSKNVPIKKDLMDGQDYSLVPQQVWEQLIQWYTLSGPAIQRKMIEVGINKELQVEVYLTNIIIIRKDDKSTRLNLEVSKSSTVAALKIAVAGRTYIAPHNIRIRQILDGGAGGKHRARDLLDPQYLRKKIEEVGIIDGSIILADSEMPALRGYVPPTTSTTTDTTSTANNTGGTESSSGNKDSDGTYPLEFDLDKDDNDMDVDYLNQRPSRPTGSSSSSSSSSSYVGSGSRSKLKTGDSDDDDDSDGDGEYKPGSSSSSRHSGSTRGSTSDGEDDDKSRYSLRRYIGGGGGERSDPGATGLQNLGNTCFMNSALQCLSNTEPLTEYFLADKYKTELNPSNPLGMGGKIAEEYGKLLKQMWKGSYSYVAPSEFKWIVGRFAPQFSGYRQHDSQELLAFLLDGLHEDLNRVLKKEYVEQKDADPNTPDPVIAAEAWTNHLKRNKSVIVDLFQGLLKSTVHCPDCFKISVKFDPYMFLSLPLPEKINTTINVTYVSMDPQEPHKKMSIKVEKNGQVHSLCNAIASRLGITEGGESIKLGDVYRHRIFQMWDDKTSLSNIRENDDTYAYQIIPNSNQTKCVHIQLVHRKKDESISSFESYDAFGTPYLLTIPKTEQPLSGLDLYSIIFSKYASLINYHLLPKNDDGTYVKSDQIIASNDYKKIFVIMKVDHPFASGEIIDCNSAENATAINPALTDKDVLAINWVNPKYFDWEKEQKSTVNVETAETEKKKKGHTTLYDCVDLFVSQEKLGKNDEWYCPSCKEHKQATKKFDLYTLPEILVVHLKRFQYTRWSRDKIDSLIDYPVEDFDLTNYVLSDEHKQLHSCHYQLFAVSIHGGGLGGGHYTAYGYNYKSKKWYNFNDSSVSAMGKSNVVTSGAYLLFYRRINNTNNAITSNNNADNTTTTTTTSNNNAENNDAMVEY